MHGEIDRDQTVLHDVVVRSTGGLDLVAATTSRQDRDEVLVGLGAWLTEHEYVRAKCTGTLLAREAAFRTGLETPDGGIALAHTGASPVARAAVMRIRAIHVTLHC